MSPTTEPTGCGYVRPWHDPHNNACHHNHEGGIGLDCTCKLLIPKGKKRHKPRVTFRVTDLNVERRVKPELLVELHDDGKMIIREYKRKKFYATSVGKVYCQLMRNHELSMARDALRAKQEKRNKASRDAKARRRKR